MASIFLSYDHDDAGRAAPIAAALEKAGHSVWWDRRIAGGAQFAHEIEGAVERADAVIVLWSERSVRSAWVRDEASEGRDQGKLIPVRLDTVKPPMGFRQYQTIDMAGWKGRGRTSVPSDLLQAIEALSERPASEASRSVAAPTSARRIPPLLLAGIAMAAVAALGLFWWRPWAASSPRPLVAVVATDESAGSRSLAGNLLVQLGSLQAANADALDLVEQESVEDADLVFKAGAVAGSAEPRAGLSLIDNESRTLLWSREFAQPGGNGADLRQQLAYSAGQVLRCTTEALTPDHPKLELTTLRLYLNGCADLSDLTDRRTVRVFQSVTQQAPRFAGGWSKLLIAELEAFKTASVTDRALQASLRRRVMQARKVNPNLAEIYLVQSWLQPPRPILGWMRYADEALEKNPDNSEILQNQAIGLGHFGRMRDAISHATRATEVDPLSPGARQTLIGFLADSGAYAAAERKLDEAERLWPGASNLRHTRFLLEYRYGNPRKALSMLERGHLGMMPLPTQTSFLAARIHPSPANIERAVAQARQAYTQDGALHQFVQTLASLGRKDEVIAVLQAANPAMAPGVISVFFRVPFAEVRRDARFMAVAQRYGLIDYWRASGRWPDYCSEPDLPYDCKAEAAKHGS